MKKQYFRMLTLLVFAVLLGQLVGSSVGSVVAWPGGGEEIPDIHLEEINISSSHKKGDPISVSVRLKNYGTAARNVQIIFCIKNIDSPARYGMAGGIWTDWQSVDSYMSYGEEVPKNYQIGPYLQNQKFVMNVGSYRIYVVSVKADGYGEVKWYNQGDFMVYRSHIRGAEHTVFAYCLYDDDWLDWQEYLARQSSPYYVFNEITWRFRDHHCENEFDINIVTTLGMWNPSSQPYGYFAADLKQAAGQNLNLGHDWRSYSRNTHPDNHGYDILWGVTGQLTTDSTVLGLSGDNWCWSASGNKNGRRYDYLGLERLALHELSHCFDTPDDCGGEQYICCMRLGWNWCDSCEDDVADHVQWHY